MGCAATLFHNLTIGCLSRQNVLRQHCFYVVLATVPGFPAAVRVWTRTGWSCPGCYPENRSTHRVQGQVRTGPRFHYAVPTTLAPIKYLSSDRIMTWSIHKLCSISRSFTSRFQICDPNDIRWVAVKYRLNLSEIGGFSIATQRILVGSQISKREVNERPKLHNLRIVHVVIRSELKYLIGARNAAFWGAGFVWKPVETVRFPVGTGRRTDPGIWTRC